MALAWRWAWRFALALGLAWAAVLAWAVRASAARLASEMGPDWGSEPLPQWVWDPDFYPE